MTNNTKKHRTEHPTMKVFLGNFIYAELMKGRIRLTDEDGCGRVLDTIMLDNEQIIRLKELLCGS